MDAFSLLTATRPDPACSERGRLRRSARASAPVQLWAGGTARTCNVVTIAIVVPARPAQFSDALPGSCTRPAVCDALPHNSDQQRRAYRSRLLMSRCPLPPVQCLCSFRFLVGMSFQTHTLLSGARRGGVARIPQSHVLTIYRSKVVDTTFLINFGSGMRMVCKKVAWYKPNLWISILSCILPQIIKTHPPHRVPGRVPTTPAGSNYRTQLPHTCVLPAPPPV